MAARRPRAARVLARHAAARGTTAETVGPVYRSVSRIAYRACRYLGPAALVRCFPGAAGEHQGLAHLEARLILVNSELLGEDPAALDLAGPRDRARVYAWLGVLAHENGHLDFTDQAASNAAVARGAPEAYVTLLEEPRMEARQASVRPHTRQLLRASANDVVWPLVEAHVADHPRPDRALAALVGCYVVGREHAGILAAAEAAPARELCEALLGAADLAALDSILARQVALPDADVEDRAGLARELAELVGDPPADAPAPGGGRGGGGGPSREARVPAAQRPGRGGDAGGGQGPGGREGPDGREGPGDALARIRRALEGASGEAADALDDASEGRAGDAVGRLPARVLDEMRGDRHVAGPAQPGSGGRYAGIPSGRPVPDHGDRPPTPHEAAARRGLARRLARVRFVRDRGRLRDLPPGRLKGAQAVRLAAQRARGAVPTARPFRRRETARGELLKPQVAIAIDTSGSMSPYAPVLGSVAWVIAGAVADRRGRFHVSAFGDGIGEVLPAGDPLRRVPEVRTGGGTSYLAEAVETSLRALPLRDRRQPRVVVVISDGEWIDPDGRAAGLLADLRGRGVAICHVGIGRPPHVAAEADAAATVTDPLTAERVVGDAIVGAMERHLAR